jgi:hypothetical protein
MHYYNPYWRAWRYLYHSPPARWLGNTLAAPFRGVDVPPTIKGYPMPVHGHVPGVPELVGRTPPLVAGSQAGITGPPPQGPGKSDEEMIRGESNQQ